MTYEATVSDIQEESVFEEKNYNWGMFIRTVHRLDGSRYKLVHYYIEGDFPPERLGEMIEDVQKFLSENPIETAAIALVGFIGASLIFGVASMIRRRKKKKN
ncbi:hypothetical protein ES708_34036 [subsurface metagenome]